MSDFEFDDDDLEPDLTADDEGNNELNFDLLPDAGSTGTLRQSALDNVATYKSSGFRVSILEKHIVHGLHDGVESNPASLLVYEVALRSDRKKHKRRIRYLKLSLMFEADPLKQPADDPWLVSWEPAMRGDVFIHPSNVSHTEETKDTVGIKAKKEPVEASAEREHTKGMSFDRNDKASCTVDTAKTETRGGGRKGRDVVEWQLLENKSQELLPDSFGVAVIVRRSPTLNFRVIFNVKLEVDFWYDVATAFDKTIEKLLFKGSREMSKTYDVTGKGKVPDGVQKNNLKELADRDGLDDFVFFHEPEEVQSAKHYG